MAMLGLAELWKNIYTHDIPSIVIGASPAT
jgi:hypothetical protein